MESVVLSSNGLYLNRGCQAIDIGTQELLHRVAVSDDVVTLLPMATRQGLAEEEKRLGPRGVRTFGALKVPSKFSRVAGRLGLIGGKGPSLDVAQIQRIASGAVYIACGGDNYTLDYGVPHNFVGIDEAARAVSSVNLLWGASVGPFDGHPLASELLEHLARFDAIAVRETVTYDYLLGSGVDTDIVLLPDPSFAMKPVACRGFSREVVDREIVLGLNVSPLVALKRSDDWRDAVSDTADAVRAICREFDCAVVLIPHVDSPSREYSDFDFLDDVMVDVRSENLPVFSPVKRNWDATQIKWLLGRCDFVIAARTHVTFASLSSSVPTGFLSYSSKSKGLARDVYQGLDVLREVDDCSPAGICEILDSLVRNRHLVEGLTEEFRLRSVEQLDAATAFLERWCGR